MFRGLLCRLRDVALILASFGAGLVSWSLFVAATSSQTVRALLQFLRSRAVGVTAQCKGAACPVEPCFPRSCTSTGVTAAFMFHHDFNYHLLATSFRTRCRSHRHAGSHRAVYPVYASLAAASQSPPAHVGNNAAGAALLTSLWHEFPAWQYAQMKRYNFLPLLVLSYTWLDCCAKGRAGGAGALCSLEDSCSFAGAVGSVRWLWPRSRQHPSELSFLIPHHPS